MSAGNRLCDWVKYHSKIQGDRVFLSHEDSSESWTYNELNRLAFQLMQWSESKGFVSGDRIAFLFQNHGFFFPLMVACASKGLILVPINPGLLDTEIESILEHAEPKIVISQKPINFRRLRVIVLSLEELHSQLIPVGDGVGLGDPTSDPTSGQLLIYTSGTTGAGKAVLLSEANLTSMAEAFFGLYSIASADRFYCVLPTYHMNAIMLTGLLPLRAGAQVLLGNPLNMSSAKFYWETVSQKGISICSLVPSLLNLFLEMFPGGSPEPHLPRMIFSGAAPLPKETWETFERVFGVPVYQGYGLTETTTWATAVPPIGDRRYFTVGKPLGSEIRINREKKFEIADMTVCLDRTDDDLKHMTSGEILIRSPFNFVEYFKDPELTKASVTEEGFLKTGDLGFLDHDGFLHITGRIKEIIIRNGTNISSREIDDVLMQHPAVSESQTIGMPSVETGESVHAVCVLKSDAQGVNTRDLHDWLHTRVSEYRRPDRITIMGYLPKSPTGKVSIYRLRRILDGQLARDLFAALNTAKWRRAHPTNPIGVQESFQKSLLAGGPISYVAYWGCGKRSLPNAEDFKAIDRLRDICRITEGMCQVPSRLILILADTHAKINGHREDHFLRYFGGIRKYLNQFGIESYFMGELWQKGGVDFQHTIGSPLPEAVQTLWDGCELKEALIEQSHRHCQSSLRGEKGAQCYFHACLRESDWVTQLYSHAIFLTYNDPSRDPLSPRLPVMHLFSTKKGVTAKPWFMDD